MKNQRLKIKGYRDLSEEEITGMNRIKEKAEEVGRLIEILEELEGANQRWVTEGKTLVQLGFMALVRSIAKPETF